MDYDNLIEDRGIYLYKDESLNTIFINLIFRRDNGSKNDTIYQLLTRYLQQTNKIYKNIEEIRKVKNDCYSIDIDMYNCYYGDNALMYVTFDLVSAQVLGDNYLDKAYEFIRNMLLEPDFTNEKRLKEIKRAYLAETKQELTDHLMFAERKYKQEIYENGKETFGFATNYEYIEKEINIVTMDDLEQAYKKVINNFFKGFIYGNITDNEYERFRKIIPFENSKDEKLDFVSIPYFNKDIIEVPNNNSKESTVYITYSLDEVDKTLYNVLFDVINISGDLCTDILRDKYDLVYTSSAQVGYARNILAFKAGVDKKNIDKLISATDEIVDILKNKEKLKELLIKTRESIKNENYILSENRTLMIDTINDYVTGIFNRFNETEFANNIDELKVEDIIEKTKTLKRRNVFIYRGDLDE